MRYPTLTVTLDDLTLALQLQLLPTRQTCKDCVLAVAAQRQFGSAARVGMRSVFRGQEHRTFIGMMHPEKISTRIIQLFDSRHYDEIRPLLPVTFTLEPDPEA